MTAKPRRRPGFTLVELLVVIGVIAILIALLFPALSKARKQAQQVACMSNMRQVSSAFLAYAQAQRGWFPAPANVAREQPEDWVHWQPWRELGESPIFAFLGNDPDVLKCPAGPPERVPPAGHPPYPFNYSVNHYFTGDSHSARFGGSGGWVQRPCKLSEVVYASQKILLIDEDVTATNDGLWSAGGGELPEGRNTSVSVLHDRGREFGAWRDTNYMRAGRGNAAFADGHCELLERVKLAHPAYINPGTSRDTGCPGRGVTRTTRAPAAVMPDLRMATASSWIE